MESIPAASFMRVSSDEQERANQVADIERLAAHHGYAIGPKFTVDDSAWRDGTGGPEYQAELKRALDAAHRGEMKVLIVWALDRLTRNGAEDALRLIRRFRERGVMIVSVQESWLSASPEVQDVLVAFAGWMAQQESRRKSERVKAALQRRRDAGLPVGRQPGAVDKSPRRRSGYVASWETGGRRRAAHKEQAS